MGVGEVVHHGFHLLAPAISEGASLFAAAAEQGAEEERSGGELERHGPSIVSFRAIYRGRLPSSVLLHNRTGQHKTDASAATRFIYGSSLFACVERSRCCSAPKQTGLSMTKIGFLGGIIKASVEIYLDIFFTHT